LRGRPILSRLLNLSEKPVVNRFKITGMLLTVLLTAGRAEADNPYHYALGSPVTEPHPELSSPAESVPPEGDLFLTQTPDLCFCGEESWFKVKTVQFMTGYYTSDTGLGLAELEFDWVPYNLRFGCVLDWPA